VTRLGYGLQWTRSFCRRPRSHVNDRPTRGEAPAQLPPMIWRFAQAEFDELRWTLQVAGQKTELEPRPLEVLRQLLRYAGEVVRKDELVEAVYGHQHVSDGALNQAVSRLRAALGDRDQKIIATVHRLGYRIAVPVEAQPALESRAHAARLQAGATIPGRDDWELVEALGSNRDIEVWLARHRRLDERRVFKFSVDGVRLSSLKREVTLYRMLREQLGDRDDRVRLIDWNFDRAPFFIEAEFGGPRLDDWAQSLGGLATLPLDTRLELLADIADAIGAAHSVGVLHKDLKPANVLVFRDGAGRWRPRLADFGSGHLLAVAQDAALQPTLTVADQGAAGSTTLYVAPELLTGQSPTALADIYALGVLLYQLVVGNLSKPLAPGWEQDVDDALLRQDIALAVDGNPERRQTSARELALQLRRLPWRRREYQRQLQAEQQADEARRAAEREHAMRPWRRAALAAIGIGFVGGAVLYEHALRASRDARQQAQLAESVTDFFNTELLAVASPYDRIGGAPNPTIQEAVDRAVARIGDRFSDQPATEAAIRATIGQIYGEMTHLPAALEQDRLAVELFERSLGATHPRTLRARYWWAQDLTEATQFDAAAEQLRRADADAARGDVGEARTQLSRHRAHCYHAIIRSQFQDAVPHCEATVELQQQVDPRDHTALFKWRANLATLYSRMGRFTDADPLFESGLAALRERGAADSLTAARFGNLYGLNLLAQQRYADAEAVLAPAYAVMNRNAPNTLYTFETLGLLATIYNATGRFDQALTAARDSYQGYQRTAGDTSHFTAQAAALLAVCRFDAGESQAGLQQLDEARAQLVQLLGPDHPQTQWAMYRRAELGRRAGLPPADLDTLLASLSASALHRAEPRDDWPERLAALRDSSG